MIFPVHKRGEGKDARWGPIHISLRDSVNMSAETFEKANFGMIYWKHCNVIVQTAHIWLPEFLEAAKSFKNYTAPYKILGKVIYNYY